MGMFQLLFNRADVQSRVQRAKRYGRRPLSTPPRAFRHFLLFLVCLFRICKVSLLTFSISEIFATRVLYTTFFFYGFTLAFGHNSRFYFRRKGNPVHPNGLGSICVNTPDKLIIFNNI